MATRMQQRRGTAAQWTAANPTLAAGEIGFETDTSKFKMGNGSSAWSALAYFTNATELNAAISNLIDAAPGTLDTLNELAAAVGDDPAFFTTVATNLESHRTSTGVHGIADTTLLTTVTQVNTAITAAIGTHEADTTNVHGIANTANLATVSNVESAATNAATALSTHSADTTSVHGIADTAQLETLSGAQSKADAAAAGAVSTHNSDTTLVHGIADTSLLETVSGSQSKADAAAAGAVSTHNSDTTLVHGIADTAQLVTQDDLTDAISAAETDFSTFGGTGIDWNAVNSRFDIDSTVATKEYADAAVSTHQSDTTNVHGIVDTAELATKSYADAIGTTATNALALKAALASPTFTGTVVLPTVTAGGSIVPGTDNIYDLGSPTKMWKDIYVGPGSLYVNGQKVLQDESGAIVVSADVDENLGLRTSGSGNIELDPTGTGSVNIKGPLVVEAGANFSSADGNGIAFSNGIKSDSVASKTLNTDLSLSGNGTGKVYLNDNAEVNGNLVVTGNFTVSGTTTSVNTETISLADNLIDLNSNFTTGSPTENSGIRVVRGDSNAVQLRWNESTDKWEFTNDGTNYSVIAPTDSPTFTGTVTIPAGASISGFAPLNAPTFTGAVTVAASGVVFTDGTQTKAGVPSITNIPTAIAAGAHTLAAGRSDQLIPLTGAVVITLPATGYSTGQSIDFYQESGTGARFESTNGVVATPGRNFRTTNSVVTAMKTASGWLVFGDLAV
jgi:hypothetical protein